ncbi:Hemolysin-type calcium-binding region [Thalassoporum mexicanum PCC 7367]|uniref:calcium-binding protein n=1 Tax=Thalassoporum mexicanum TaxID=3457544 RepID=UPI00029FA954|nr:calcium-binding protein [Pseudanabaena sp. PCC 7367]AFY70782.1 Hemolysin-type calcium-binding region [Pseudanabaena sp. PCC 7367]
MTFFDLTNNSEFRSFFPGELSGFNQGVRAFEGNDTLVGSSDSETFNGNGGNDIISGNFGFDFIRGGRDNDTIDGEADNDIVNGNRGDDIVRGGENADVVRGGRGNDDLFGDRGRDTLIGDAGIDDLFGGQGSDTFVLRTDNAAFGIVNADAVRDFNAAENDRLGLDTRITVNDIILDDRVDYSGIFGGTTENDTVISIGSSGLILGVFLDTPLGEIAPRTDILPDSLIYGTG